MKKIILLISIFVFSFAISVLCFASEPEEPTDTYSLSTELDFIGRIGDDRHRVKIDISGLSSNYVVIPYFRYFLNSDNHWLSFSLGLYDKNEDITYIAGHSYSEKNFIQNFFDNGQIKLTESSFGVITSSEGLLYGLGEQSVMFLDLKSNNYRLPYYITSKFCSLDEYPFSLSDVKNKGTWFVSGNNYPFNNNSVYSSDIYYPLLDGFEHFRDKNKPDYTFTFGLSRNNPKYSDLNNYYLEIWSSSETDTKLVFQSTYKLTDLPVFRSYTGEAYYSFTRDFYEMFPNGSPYFNFTVYARLRYVSGDINLVGSYQYYLQHYYMAEDPKIAKVYQVDGLLPESKLPDTIESGSINPDSQVGYYDFGNFNALEFVKGGGGLASLTQGVSTVFSFLPSWLWQMLWYVLGALAVIALLKVIIS